MAAPHRGRRNTKPVRGHVPVRGQQFPRAARVQSARQRLRVTGSATDRAAHQKAGPMGYIGPAQAITSANDRDDDARHARGFALVPDCISLRQGAVAQASVGQHGSAPAAPASPGRLLLCAAPEEQAMLAAQSSVHDIQSIQLLLVIAVVLSVIFWKLVLKMIIIVLTIVLTILITSGAVALLGSLHHLIK